MHLEAIAIIAEAEAQNRDRRPVTAEYISRIVVAAGVSNPATNSRHWITAQLVADLINGVRIYREAGNGA